MFIATSQRIKLRLQRSRMWPQHRNIALRWSAGLARENGNYKHLVPPGPEAMFEQHTITHYLQLQETDLRCIPLATADAVKHNKGERFDDSCV
jgi:hypothetical protein